MGQQQLLLIVLGLLIVSIAVYTGTRMVADYSADEARNSLVTQLASLYTEARAYAMKPKSAGGGGGRFNGYTIPKSAQKRTLGTFTSTVSGNYLYLFATGNVIGKNGRTGVRVYIRCTVTAEKVRTVTVN